MMDLSVVDDTLREYTLSFDERDGDISHFAPVIPDESFVPEAAYDNLFFLNNQDDIMIVWVTIDGKVVMVPWHDFSHVVETTPDLLKIAKTKSEIEQLLSFSKL